MIRNADRVTRVLDYSDTARRAELSQFAHPTKAAAIMHDNDRFGPRRDQATDLTRVDRRLIEAADVGENRCRADCDRHICGRDKVERRLDDLVTGSDTEREQREMETRRRARHGQGMLSLLHRGELLFEGLHLRSHRQPPTGDDALDSVRLLASVVQITQWHA